VGFRATSIKRIEGAGLRLRANAPDPPGRAQAEAFYEVHKARPFYGSLCEYMSSGPVVVMALEADGAIAKWRDLMGATDPPRRPRHHSQRVRMMSKRTATHGSDAPETAAREVGVLLQQSRHRGVGSFFWRLSVASNSRPRRHFRRFAFRAVVW